TRRVQPIDCIRLGSRPGFRNGGSCLFSTPILLATLLSNSSTFSWVQSQRRPDGVSAPSKTTFGPRSRNGSLRTKSGPYQTSISFTTHTSAEDDAIEAEAAAKGRTNASAWLMRKGINRTTLNQVVAATIAQPCPRARAPSLRVQRSQAKPASKTTDPKQP